MTFSQGKLAPMIAKAIQHQSADGGTRFQAVIEASSTARPEAAVHFDFDRPVSRPRAMGDPWLPALLVPAMFAGEDLEIQAPVSARILRTCQEIQYIFHAWHPNLLRPITVAAETIVPTEANDDSGPVAAFFSGGVDSWFTFDQHRAEISALITAKGFDIPYADTTIWPELKAINRAIARETGKTLIAVKTNLRQQIDPENGCFKTRPNMDFWGYCYHGACLAAVGLFLQGNFSRVLVPSSWHYSRLQPWGSHPALDPLWSNGGLEIVHDGARLTRLQKLGAICHLDLAMRHLRVCPCYRPGLYNCGECEKCRRTIVSLRLYKALDRCTAFERPLDLRAWELDPPSRHLELLYREMLALAENNHDPELARTLRILVGDRWSPRVEWLRWRRRMGRSIAKRWRRWTGRAPGAVEKTAPNRADSARQIALRS